MCKKLMAVIFSLAILAGCAANEDTEIPETVSETAAVVSEAATTTTVTTETSEDTTNVSETTSDTATENSETKAVPLSRADLGINPDGTLNDKFTERLTELATPDEPVHYIIYPSLWDFDGDGVPEIILTNHNSGQGLMPCHVYSAETLEEIGEFEGFCRDGFTRFINNDEGTLIYNFYEHSAHIRFESAEKIKLENDKLVRESKTAREWVMSNSGAYKPHLEYYEAGSTDDERNERDFINRTAEYYYGDVCTSYDNDTCDVKNAVESYNNYIRSQALITTGVDRLLIFGDKNEYAFLQTEEGCFFIAENGEKTLLKEGWAYIELYILGDVIVCQPLGNTQPCDVYVMTDGKPELVAELSGKGMYLDHSHLYNGGYELTHSTYDGQADENLNPIGYHTFKKYQLYRDRDGFHEYGSIVVPMEEFTEIYGEKIKSLSEELAKEDKEIYEVLYREDGCFILNCRKTIFLDEEKKQPAGAYYMTNITIKPLYDGSFIEVCRDRGTYKTALIPEIAVYPEKMYTPENN